MQARGMRRLDLHLKVHRGVNLKTRRGFGVVWLQGRLVRHGVAIERRLASLAGISRMEVAVEDRKLRHVGPQPNYGRRRAGSPR